MAALTWVVCPVCGAVVADKDLHDQWHQEEPDGE